ncbi:MAG TPA: ribose-phosphate diphosphokinase [Candidatus Binatia bacterium]|nr:ribose-phosphate diphosphokinase [Candidatus Binatia bacterium]
MRSNSSATEADHPHRAARIHAFPDSLNFGRALARASGTSFARVAVHRFPDGESLITVRQPVGRRAVLVRSLFDPNAKLIEVVLAADALRRAGAQHVTLVAPYLPYMRQDKVFASGQPISQRVIGDVLGRAFDRVLTLEAHLHRTRRLSAVMGRHASSLSAAPALAAWITRRARGALIVGPDAESRPWVRAIARAANAPWVVGTKQRLSDRSVRLHFLALPAARRAVVIDDIASSGTTLAVAARALRRAQINQVDAIVVHAVFASGAIETIRAAGVRRIVSCDTVAHHTNAIGVARLFVPALSRR